VTAGDPRPGEAEFLARPGEAEFLAQYDPLAYAPVAVTADIVLLTVRAGQLSVLLVERAQHPYQHRWALPGGFVEADEDLDDAARRELVEETGVALAPNHLEQLRSYGTPGRDPRMRVVTVAYLAFTAVPDAPVAGDDARRARFFAIDDLAIDDLTHSSDAPPSRRHGTPLAFDHARIVADGVERARSKLEYTTLATAFVDETFTLGELRRVYEAVWGMPLHEANFRRKVLGTPGFVEPTGATMPTDGRPAQLYRKGQATSLHPPILRPN
jgi:8-oxo-dGTP diphosphatase